MTREEILKDMQGMFGVVPDFVKGIPESLLVHEYDLIKSLLLAEGPIPKKYSALIGLGVASVIPCRYTSALFAEIARVSGATDEEIESACQRAAGCAAVSAYLNGLGVGEEKFRRDLDTAVSRIRSFKKAA